MKYTTQVHRGGLHQIESTFNLNLKYKIVELVSIFEHTNLKNYLSVY